MKIKIPWFVDTDNQNVWVLFAFIRRIYVTNPYVKASDGLNFYLSDIIRILDSEDKDIAGIFAELLPIAGGLVLYQAHHPRAASSDQLVGHLEDFTGVCQIADSSQQAFAAAAEIAGADGVVLATGSLYLVGELRGELV